jgi:hypothetical protein
MGAYSSSETALVNLIIANITGYTANNCVAGEADAAFAYANKNNTNVCLLDYAGGREDTQVSPHGQVQTWINACKINFFLSYDAATIEATIRSTVNSILQLRRDNKRLSTGAVWRLVDAAPPRPVKRNDRPWIWLEFTANIKEPV